MAEIEDTCPACGSLEKEDLQISDKEIKLPILPICVDTNKEKDILFPIKLSVCNNCGLLYLNEVANPKNLYDIFHSEAIGKVWDEEFDKFSEIIKSNLDTGKILEVGAGTGKLIKRLAGNKLEISAIDPSYSGPSEGIHIYRELFDEKFVVNHTKEFDAVISEHTIEHFLEFQKYFENTRKVLKDGGLLFTSVPNQEYSFSQGQTNQINLEHTSLCTNLHWIYLHLKHGFSVESISFHKGHSMQIVSKKLGELPPIKINTKEISISMFDNFKRLIKEKLDKVKIRVHSDRENWIFGAANSTQWLFALGLDESLFEGILDNSDTKKNKRLYGTTLITHKPEEIITENKNNLRIFINLGNYNQEVLEQIKQLNPSIECILL
jgi:SAM-dependent methyltransferase